MEKQDMIRKVTEGQPTDWVNNLVFQCKPSDKLCICLDQRDLNKAINREHHAAPTLEKIIPKLKVKFFSTSDAKSEYWNVRLDEESSCLTTFNMPFGQYQFLCMPFGLKMSQDIFQHRIDQFVEGLGGVVAIADDIIVFGERKQEHNANLCKLLERRLEYEAQPGKAQCQQTRGTVL